MALNKGEVVMNLTGPDGAEFREAAKLLCRKYGAQLRFDVEADEDARKALRESLESGGLKVRFVDPTVHAKAVARAAAVAPPLALMVVEADLMMFEVRP